MLNDMEFGLTSRETSPNREAANQHSMGKKKYSEMVSSGSKAADDKNLPFSFSAAKKSGSRSVICECPGCSELSAVTKNTVMLVCSSCKKLFDVDETTIIKQ